MAKYTYIKKVQVEAEPITLEEAKKVLGKKKIESEEAEGYLVEEDGKKRFVPASQFRREYRSIEAALEHAKRQKERLAAALADLEEKKKLAKTDEEKAKLARREKMLHHMQEISERRMKEINQ